MARMPRRECAPLPEEPHLERTAGFKRFFEFASLTRRRDSRKLPLGYGVDSDSRDGWAAVPQCGEFPPDRFGDSGHGLGHTGQPRPRVGGRERGAESQVRVSVAGGGTVTDVASPINGVKEHHPDSPFGMRRNDPAFDINWHTAAAEISNKDRTHPNREVEPHSICAGNPLKKTGDRP